MSDIETELPRLSDPQDAEVTEYQAVSGLAVAGLVIALFSPVALVHPALWAAPVLGIVVCAAALRRIALLTPALVGRKAALAGLVWSVLFGTLAASEWLTYRQLVDWEARRFAAHWFEFLRQGQPLKSHQLSEHPGDRQPLDERLWTHYGPETEGRRNLQMFVQRPEIRSLLALGPKAHARYYDTEDQYRDEGADVVDQVYAVIWQEAGQRESFFIRLVMKRHQLPETGRADWEVLNFEGGIRPKALAGGGQSQQG